MPTEQTKQLCVFTREKLREAKEKLEHFLNYHSVPQLIADHSQPDEEQIQYYCDYLADLRHLSVSCDINYEKISLVLRRAKFNHDYAEKVLNEVVHSCISYFYYPLHEVYEEDGRYCYTNQDAIKFRQTPAEPLKEITLSLSKIFQDLRDELEYYETDYVTRIRMRNVQS